MTKKVFFEIAKERFNVRSYKDKRKKVNRLTVRYKDYKGEEYRKSYEFPANYTFNKMMEQIPKHIE